MKQNIGYKYIYRNAFLFVKLMFLTQNETGRWKDWLYKIMMCNYFILVQRSFFSNGINIKTM